MTEKELCDQYIQCLKNNYPDSVIVPEFDGWDIYYMIGNIRFGVQAKLQFNTKVIAQCLNWDNVHFRIILLPTWVDAFYGDELLKICRALKIMIICTDSLLNNYTLLKFRHRPKELPQIVDLHKLPAGVKSPRTVTEEKIALCKLERLYNEKSYLSTQDFYDVGFEKGQKEYYWFDKNLHQWKIKDKKASELWPHIWENLNG